MTSLSRRTSVLVGVLTFIVYAFVPAMSASGGEYYSTEVDVCNKGGQRIWVAVAVPIEVSWFSPDIWKIKGWKKVSPHDCVEVHSDYSDYLSANKPPYLAFSQIGKDGKDGIATYLPEQSFFGDDHIRSVSKQFCVHPKDGFEYEFSGDNMRNCPPPFELANFSIMVLGFHRRDSTITVNIDPSDATSVTPFGSPPSVAEVPQRKVVPPPTPVAPRKPGWIGVTIQDVPPELARSLLIQESDAMGVLVSAVTIDGPANKAGMLSGDILLAVTYWDRDSKKAKTVKLNDAEQLKTIVGTIKNEDEIYFRVLRKDEVLTSIVTAQEKPIEKR